MRLSRRRRRAERQHRLRLKRDWWDELPPELRLPSMEELERLSQPEAAAAVLLPIGGRLVPVPTQEPEESRGGRRGGKTVGVCNEATKTGASP